MIINQGTTMSSEIKRIGITGCNGIVGTILRRRLSKDGFEIVSLSRRDLPIVKEAKSKNELDCVVENRIVDTTNAEELKGKFDGLDAVIHLAAASKPTDKWEKVFKTNYGGDHNVFAECARAGIKRLIYASTNHVQTGKVVTNFETREAVDPNQWGAHLIGKKDPKECMIRLEDSVDPDSYYGTSKVAAEALGKFFARVHGLEFVAFRIGWIVNDQNPLQNPRIKTEEQRNFWRALYLSHRDCEEFFVRALQPTLPESCKVGKGVYVLSYAISHNPRRFFDLTTTIKILGYTPQDSAEYFIEQEQGQSDNGQESGEKLEHKKKKGKEKPKSSCGCASCSCDPCTCSNCDCCKNKEEGMKGDKMQQGKKEKNMEGDRMQGDMQQGKKEESVEGDRMQQEGKKEEGMQARAGGKQRGCGRPSCTCDPCSCAPCKCEQISKKGKQERAKSPTHKGQEGIKEAHTWKEQSLEGRRAPKDISLLQNQSGESR